MTHTKLDHNVHNPPHHPTRLTRAEQKYLAVQCKPPMLYIWYSTIHYLQSSSGTWKCLVKFACLFSFLMAYPSLLQ